MKGLITAGGRGTRMRPMTFSTNKHLIPLANKPLIFYAVETLAQAGIKKIGINYNPGQLEELQSTLLPQEKKYRVKFTFILQEKPAGLANIIEVSQGFLGKGKFIMHLGDNIFYGGIGPLVKQFAQSKAQAFLIAIHHPENSRLGVPYFDRKGRLVKVVEKPKKPPHDLGVPGLYFLDDHVFGCFRGRDRIKPSARGEYEITAVYNWLLEKGYQVETKTFEGVWRDPGKFDDWLATNQFLLDNNLKNGCQSQLDSKTKIEGRVQIGKRCHIKNSIPRGPLVIGDQVRIENSFIGPYSAIGDQCQINSAKIENSVLTKKVIINGPRQTLDSCLVGEGTIIERSHRPLNNLQLFVGNSCILKL